MTESQSPLSPLTDGETELRKEFRKRNTIWELETIKLIEEEEYLSKGWEKHKLLKNGIKVRKLRELDQRLENKWWVLLCKMGYKEMNLGRQFRILLKRRGGVEGSKQIDVFARDEETVIVTECKACERLRSRSLQKDIEEFGSLKGDLSTTIKKFYGRDFKPKILWFFVTENIIWSQEDVDRAAANSIKRVTELELPYYTQLVEHLGKAARFQFLAEFLKDSKIPQMEGHKVPATRGKVGGQVFYSFVTTPRHLLRIAFVNHRTLDDPEGHPTYQRLIQKSRLKDIGDFIQAGGYFPNNLLINFTKTPQFDILQKDLVTDVHYGSLFLPQTYKSAWVIDGQHRLYGYANLPEKYLDEKLMVLAFQGMDKKSEAELFVTINHEQKSVSKTLLDDLEGQLKWGSEDPGERIGALAARVVQQVGRDLGSPFYNRVAAEGIQTNDKACLTLPQIKHALKRSGLLGKVVSKTYERGALCGSTDNATLLRAQKVINGYFSGIMNADLARWDKGRSGRVCTNEGTQAFILLLGEIISYLYGNDPGRFLKLSEQQLLKDISPLIEPVCDFIKSNTPEVETTFTVPFGGGGPREYFFRLARIVRQSAPGFTPGDYADWEVSQSKEMRETADRQIQEINSLVQKHLFRVFRKIYGEKNNAYWERGVKNPEIKSNAYRNSTAYDPDDRGPLETYLDWIAFEKIADTKENWPIFKSVLNIPPLGVKGQAKSIEWMNRINELRRVSAHASEHRNYKSDDFDFIDRIYRTLKLRITEFDYDSVALPVESS
jgi:DNA sulfur modification protein DndB